MTAPLAGPRFLEPATGSRRRPRRALLGDLDADVVKVEPPGGDVYREFLLRSMGYTHEFAADYAFHLDNRGRRSAPAGRTRTGRASTSPPSGRAPGREAYSTSRPRRCRSAAADRATTPPRRKQTFDMLAELGAGNEDLKLATEG